MPVPKDALVQKVWISDLYKGPRIRIFEMSIEAPFHAQWPPLSHQGIAGTETNASNLNVEQVLLKFASKALRRPVKLEEITQYIDYVKDHTTNS